MIGDIYVLTNEKLDKKTTN